MKNFWFRFLRPPVAVGLGCLFLQAQSPLFLGFALRHPEAFGADLLRGPLVFLLDGCASGLLLWGCAVPALWAARRFRFLEGSLLRLPAAFLLGSTAVSFLLMAVGAAGGFRRPLLGAIGAAIAAAGLLEIRRALPRIRAGAAAFLGPVSPEAFFLIFALSAAGARALIATGAPPTDWDALAYHLAFPKIYLAEGRLLRLPWSINAHYPFNAEMLYTLGLALRGDVFCHWLNAWHGAIFLGFVAAVGARYFSPGAGLAAAAALAVQPVFQRVVGNASTDFAAALPALVAAAALLETGRSRAADRALALASGLLAGISASNKLTGLWWCAALGLIWSIRAVRGSRTGAGRDVVTLSLFALGAGATGFPWYARNWVVAGNPLWPYWSEFLGGGAAAREAWARIAASVTERPRLGLLDLLALPWTFWSQTEAFKYRPYYLTTPFFFLLVARAPWGGLGRVRKILLSVAAVFAVFWLAVYPAWRYFLPGAALLALLAASWRRDPSVPRSRRWPLAAIGLLAFVPIRELTVNAESFAFWGVRSQAKADLSPRERYLQLVLGDVYDLSRSANRSTPDGARLLLYKDVRGYYLDRPYAWGDPLNPGVMPFGPGMTVDAAARTLRELGFTHMVYNPLIAPYRGDRAYYEAADRLIEGVIARWGRVEARHGGVALVALSTAPTVETEKENRP